jgi:hypothetical protein
MSALCSAPIDVRRGIAHASSPHPQVGWIRLLPHHPSDAIRSLRLRLIRKNKTVTHCAISAVQVPKAEEIGSHLMPMTQTLVTDIWEPIDAVDCGKRTRTQLRGALNFLCHGLSTVRRRFRRLGCKHSAARDLHHEPKIARQYEPCNHGCHHEQQGKKRSKIQEPKRLQHR